MNLADPPRTLLAALRGDGSTSGRHVLRVIVGNASSLASSTIATSALGLAYWLVAARSFSQSSVGLASAAVASMTLVATFATLGLDAFILGDGQRDKSQRRPVVVAVLVAAGVAATVLSLAYILIAGHVSRDLRPLTTALGLSLFVLGAMVTAVSMVTDQSLVGALRGRLQLLRNIVFSVAKLVMLVVAGRLLLPDAGLTIFGSWVVGAALSFLALVAVRPRWVPALWRLLRPRAVLDVLQQVTSSVLRHQALNLGLRLPLLALPVVVITVLTAEANAKFYLAWQLANTAFVLPGALASMLYAVGAADPVALAERLRFTLRASAVLSVLAATVLVVAARPIMSLFGVDYVDAYSVLAVLALSGLPTLVKNHYVAVARITGRIRAAMPVIYAGAALELVLAVVGGVLQGLTGLVVGWVAALVLEAIVMVPLLRRAWHATLPGHYMATALP